MTTSSLPAPRLPKAALWAAVTWFAVSILAGATGFLLRLPIPGTQLIILGLLAAVLVTATTVRAVRRWVEALPLRVLIGINGLRFVGIVFLALAARGQLDATFATRAGWGDIAVALLALVFVVAGNPRSASFRNAVLAWNAFGALDLIVAVATATAATLRGSTPGIGPILSFPLVVVPTFFVPLFLANHVVIFRRLLASASRDH